MTHSLLFEKQFFCREWAFAKINHSLECCSSSKTCGILLLGGPGSGKTALCCELVRPSNIHGKQKILNKWLLAYHFCQAHDISSLSLTNFINNMISQLTVSPLISGYCDRIKSPAIEAALEVAECNPDQAFKKGVLFPLLEIDPPNHSCFILVDSIDQSVFEAMSENKSRSGSIAELLSKYYHMLPKWLLLICSLRKQNKTISRMFSGFRKVVLDDLRKSYIIQDVQHYILCRLDQEEALRQHLNQDTAEMLNQLHIKSNGCFIYLEKVLDGVADSFIMLREIKEIPGTLNGLYLWLCQRLFRKQFIRVQPILDVMLASRKPLTIEVLFQCVWTQNNNLTWGEFHKNLEILSKILNIEKNKTVFFFHHSFAEWLLDVKHCTLRYLCNANNGHFMIALRYSLTSPQLSSEEILEFALHLSKISFTSVFQALDITLWLMHCNLALNCCLAEACTFNNSLAIKLLMSIGTGLSFKEIMDREIVGQPEDPLEALLSRGAAINEADHNQQTLLHIACHRGIEDIVLRLIEMGADLDAIDKSGQTPINIAARLGYHRIVEKLVKAGADLNHVDHDGWTPLRSSAWAGHIEVVNILVQSGVRVDVEDADHRTALRAAAWGGHEEIVSCLLSHGAQVNKTDNEGRNALIAAAYMGHSDIVKQLLNHGAEINHEDNDGRTALSVAALCVPASEGHASVVSWLIEKGAEVDHRDKEGMTPLLVAAFEGHHEVCELLLENEADVDHADYNGRTPLVAAASMGHSSVLNLLLFWGAAVDTIDSEGRTVLSIAAAQGNSNIVQQLLDRGLDEMHRDNGGWTPLHYAAFEGHTDACKLLIEAGAKITEIDNDGRIPLILAAQEGHTHLVKKLLGYDRSMIDFRGHDGKTALRVAALEGHTETVNLLINYGADVNYTDADGRSTLYLLALDNNIDMAEILLSIGANIETRDLEGRTALHVSAWQGHGDMIKTLLNHGADVNAVDNDCRSALQSASWQGHTSVVNILLERNATVDHVCNQGATALCIAAQEGHLEVVTALLQFGANPNHIDQFGRNPIRVASKGGHHDVVNFLEEYIAQLEKTGNYGNFPSSSNTTSCISSETRTFDSIVYQLNNKNFSCSALKPSRTNAEKSCSFESNQPSSKSSSNLTNSTNKSSSNAHSQNSLNVLATKSIKTNLQTSFKKQKFRSVMTFTEQLQECSRKRNRIGSLSPSNIPQSLVLNIQESSLNNTLTSKLPYNQNGSFFNEENISSIVQIHSPQMPSEITSTESTAVFIGSNEFKTNICTFNSSSSIAKPDPCIHKKNIITNPNYKSSSLIASDTVRQSCINHENENSILNTNPSDSGFNALSSKKETHL